MMSPLFFALVVSEFTGKIMILDLNTSLQMAVVLGLGPLNK